MVTLPSTGFDGTTSVTFNAVGAGINSTLTQDSIDPTLDDTGGLGSNAASASFNVTFYHCDIGEVWNSTSSILAGSDGDTSEGCQLCSDVVKGASEVGRVTVRLNFQSPDILPLMDPVT